MVGLVCLEQLKFLEIRLEKAYVPLAKKRAFALQQSHSCSSSLRGGPTVGAEYCVQRCTIVARSGPGGNVGPALSTLSAPATSAAAAAAEKLKQLIEARRMDAAFQQFTLMAECGDLPAKYLSNRLIIGKRNCAGFPQPKDDLICCADEKPLCLTFCRPLQQQALQ